MATRRAQAAPQRRPNPKLQAIESIGFSPRQARIIELILQGQSDKQIATALGLRRCTVRTYLSRIFARVGVADRVSLVVEVLNRRAIECAHPACPHNNAEKNGNRSA